MKELNLPIWLDPSNTNLTFRRNRVRHEIIPILEKMHPGSSKRIAKLSVRISKIKKDQDSLINLAIEQVKDEKGLSREKLSKLISL